MSKRLMAKYKKLAFDFFKEQKEFKEAQSKFEENKRRFYSEMEMFFEAEKIDKSYSFKNEDEFVNGNLEVIRIQKSNVTFNADKLEKVLSKEICKDVIEKRYEISDMTGLIAYLKECGVNPKIFKKFLIVSKSVNVKELEKLEDIGKVSIEQIKGCYTVKNQNPYFTVSFKK